MDSNILWNYNHSAGFPVASEIQNILRDSLHCLWSTFSIIISILREFNILRGNRDSWDTPGLQVLFRGLLAISGFSRIIIWILCIPGDTVHILHNSENSSEYAILVITMISAEFSKISARFQLYLRFPAFLLFLSVPDIPYIISQISRMLRDVDLLSHNFPRNLQNPQHVLIFPGFSKMLKPFWDSQIQHFSGFPRSSAAAAFQVFLRRFLSHTGCSLNTSLCANFLATVFRL